MHCSKERTASLAAPCTIARGGPRLPDRKPPPNRRRHRRHSAASSLITTFPAAQLGPHMRRRMLRGSSIKERAWDAGQGGPHRTVTVRTARPHRLHYVTVTPVCGPSGGASCPIRGHRCMPGSQQPMECGGLALPPLHRCTCRLRLSQVWLRRSAVWCSCRRSGLVRRLSMRLHAPRSPRGSPLLLHPLLRGRSPGHAPPCPSAPAVRRYSQLRKPDRRDEKATGWQAGGRSCRDQIAMLQGLSTMKRAGLTARWRGGRGGRAAPPRCSLLAAAAAAAHAAVGAVRAVSRVQIFQEQVC